VGQGGFGQHLQGLIIVHLMAAEDAAVAVVGVLAHTYVGDDIKVGVLGLDGPNGLLDHAVLVPGGGDRHVLPRVAAALEVLVVCGQAIGLPLLGHDLGDLPAGDAPVDDALGAVLRVGEELRIVRQVPPRLQLRVGVGHIPGDVEALEVVVEVHPQLCELPRLQVYGVGGDVVRPLLHMHIDLPGEEGLVEDGGRARGLLPCIAEDLLRHQAHAPHVPAEGVEAGPGDAAALQEGPGRLENGDQVPGDKVQIAVVEAGSPAQEGRCVRPGLLHHRRLQGVPEVHDLLGPVLPGEAVQGIDEKARRVLPTRRAFLYSPLCGGKCRSRVKL